MTDERKPTHQHGLPAEDLAWLNRQDKAMLVEIIGQLCWAMLVRRSMLDEAILRAHRNRLQATYRYHDDKAEAEAERSNWRAYERQLGASRRCWEQFDASWKLRPGFHREEG